MLAIPVFVWGASGLTLRLKVSEFEVSQQRIYQNFAAPDINGYRETIHTEYPVDSSNACIICLPVFTFRPGNETFIRQDFFCRDCISAKKASRL